MPFYVPLLIHFVFFTIRPPPSSTLFPYTTLFRSQAAMRAALPGVGLALLVASTLHAVATGNLLPAAVPSVCVDINPAVPTKRSEEHTSELQSQSNLVCRLLLEKKKKVNK